MAITLLDTDILSEILKQRTVAVVQRASAYLAARQQLEFSAITRYEIIRGLKEKQANRQLANFNAFCQHALVHPITDAVLDQASDLWAEARRTGRPCSDPDLIVAATALEHGGRLATGNFKHFTRISGLVIEDWRSVVKE